ncbi:MAG: DNA repair protein RecO [Deltaproteobacteria bacterium]
MARADETFDAIVVGGVDFGEADRVVHLITTQGRVAAFGHGARKSKRRFAGALDPFTTIAATISHSKKRQGTLPTLTAAVVERSRLPLRRSLESIALGSYFTELVWRVTPEGDTSDSMFSLLTAALDALEVEEASLAARRAFELFVLDELGYTPQLDRCVACGDVTDRPHVDFERGGVLCPAHAEGAPLTGPKTIQWTEGVFRASAFEPLGGHDAEWAHRAAVRLGAPMSRFFATLLDYPLKATRMLEDLEL